MDVVIVKSDGDLKREVWEFTLWVNWEVRIYLNSYSVQTKETPRHKKWVNQTHWRNGDKRGNNIDTPPTILTEVEAEARSRFRDIISAAKIIY